jgi:hypothetical protein
VFYKTIILPVVLYGCETWYLTLVEEHRLRVFENRVLRRILGPKRDEVLVTVAVRSWPVGCWDRGFESRSRHEHLYASVLCCPVQVEALRGADHSSKESYHMSK